MCHEETGDGKFGITRHLSSHMEEISLAALPAGVETDDESDSDYDDSPGDSNHEIKCCICGNTNPKTKMLQCRRPPVHWFHEDCFLITNPWPYPGERLCGLCDDEIAKDTASGATNFLHPGILAGKKSLRDEANASEEASDSEESDSSERSPSPADPGVPDQDEKFAAWGSFIDDYKCGWPGCEAGSFGSANDLW